MRFAILGDAETSTGECVRRAGNEMLFQQLASDAGRHAQRAWASSASSPATRMRFNSLRNEYPAFGGHYEVEHHTQLIARLLRRGPHHAGTAAASA